MSVPRLSRELRLEARQTLPDGVGGVTERWVILGRLWAEVVAGAGHDMPGEEVTLSSVPYRITVRAAVVGSPARPQAEQRLRDGTRLFRIVAVAERDREGRYLTCFAREEVPS